MKLKKSFSRILAFSLCFVMIFATACNKNSGGSGTEGDFTPTISGVTEKTFDKHTPSDVTFTVDLKGKGIESIDRFTATTSQALGTQVYSHSDGVLTIFAAYLNMQSNSKHNFRLTTEGGSFEFSITVTDSTPPPAENYTPALMGTDQKTFDKLEPASVTFAIDVKGKNAVSLALVTGSGNTAVGSQYWGFSDTTLSINQSYLQTLTASVTPYEFVFTTQGGTVSVYITVEEDITPMLYSSDEQSFSKNAPQDVVLYVDLRGEEIISLKEGSNPLTETNDYTFSVGTLTILADYLEGLTSSDVPYEFTLTTAGGTITFTIEVGDDVTIDYSPEITSGGTDKSFDKDDPSDVRVNIDAKGQTVVSLKVGAIVIAGSNYTYSQGILTVKAEYLGTLGANETPYTFTFTTSAGYVTFTVLVTEYVPDDTSPYANVKFYNNRDFNEYLKGTNLSTIAGQWSGYGIGDPFIMRFNGVYYLYVSTKNNQVGLLGWKSTDLVTWTQCNSIPGKLGYVSTDPISQSAYAPEVYYFNGTFYMYTAQDKIGHHILTATSPEGPFTAFSQSSYNMNIDGSVFIDDNEEMYFTYANQGGIKIVGMNSMTSFKSSTPTLSNTSMDWTEGPMIIKVNNKYFLTYTGNQVESSGYRVSYNVAEPTSGTNIDNLVGANTFSQKGAELPILLSTDDEEFKGLGHSASFLGPDMDSYYITYHSLNNPGGPNRSLNIDRLLFNGTQMSVAANKTDSVKATQPDFVATSVAEAGKFATSGDFYLSSIATGESFTAEFNYKGSDDVKFVVSYTDAQNYIYVKVNNTAKTVKLVKVTGGNEAEAASGTLVNSFNNSLHTIRIAYKGGSMDVYFDNMKKISAASITAGAGKIGYLTTDNDAELLFTAFSNVSMGDSDKREIKQSNVSVGASTYLENGTYSGVSGNNLNTGSGVVTVTGSSQYKGAKAVTLANVGDYVSYPVNFKQDGFYGIELVYPKVLGGKPIGIGLDDNVYQVTLPSIITTDATASSDYVRAIVTEFAVDAGIRRVSIHEIGDTVTFVSFRFVKTSSSLPDFSDTLATYESRGKDYKTIWKLSEGGHMAKAGSRSLVYIGDDTLQDFKLTVSMKLIGDTGSSVDAGIIIRARNYAATSYDGINSIQGYYLRFNNTNVRFDKLNYNDTLSLATPANSGTASGTWFTVEIVAKGNTITVKKNGNQLLTYTDAVSFSTGRIGLYTNRANAIYKDLTITKAD